jgi:virulence-associated protein VapD
VKIFFKGEEVASGLRIFIPSDSDVMKSVMELPYGTVVKVKCRLGFERKQSCVFLRAEEMEEIVNVKLVINE